MSGLTEDAGSSPSLSRNVAARHLYDPAFKLFGSSIPIFSECKRASSDGQDRPKHASVTFGESSSVQFVGCETLELEGESFLPDELGSSSGSNDGEDEEKMVEQIIDDLEDAAFCAARLTEKDSNEVLASTNTDEQAKCDESIDEALEKPDKPIPCPRCHSMNTKFCYFNNYNVNQPRHFCKNCQRYWTAGGMLRNVPVGAGRRKNKHLSQTSLPDAIVVRCDPPETIAEPLLSCPASTQVGLNNQIKAALPSISGARHILPLDLQSVSSFESPPSSAVLSFGQESPVCISTGRVPSFTPWRSEVLQGYKSEMSQAQAKHNLGAVNLNGAHVERKCHEGNPGRDVNATGVSINADATLQKLPARQLEVERPEASATHGSKPEPVGVSGVPNYMDAALAWGPFSFMGVPWQYGAGLSWGNTPPPSGCVNIGQGANASSAALANVIQGAANLSNVAGANPQQAAGCFGGQPPWATAISPWSGAIPWHLMQNALWGPPGWGGPWTMPWAVPFTAAAAAMAAASVAAATNADLGTTTLGKHPRESRELDGERGGPLLVPKTLRIDDPGEAARSSIWSTLGIDLRPDALTSGGIFRDLQSKADMESNDPHTRTRNSNPAAMGRLSRFQESGHTLPTVDAKGV